MSEAKLLREVIDLLIEVSGVRAGERRLLWHHCGDSRHCIGQRGFPDLIIVGQRGIIVAELKSADGDTSAEQDLWAWMLDQAGCEHGGVWPVRIWMPAELESGQIREEIEAIV